MKIMSASDYFADFFCPRCKQGYEEDVIFSEELDEVQEFKCESCGFTGKLYKEASTQISYCIIKN